MSEFIEIVLELLGKLEGVKIEVVRTPDYRSEDGPKHHYQIQLSYTLDGVTSAKTFNAVTEYEYRFTPLQFVEIMVDSLTDDVKCSLNRKMMSSINN